MKIFMETYQRELVCALEQLEQEKLMLLYEKIDWVRRHGGVIYVLGNGGSAAAAGHWVCDFAKGTSVPGQPRVKMCSPADNVSILTALGNDIAYEDVFSFQLENVLTDRDMVISLSVSGNSPNLLKAHLLAEKIGAFRVAIIGDYGGKLGQSSDLVIVIPSQNYGVVEDIHLIINHMISQYMRRENESRQAERKQGSDDRDN